jgi:hypothetical protein
MFLNFVHDDQSGASDDCLPVPDSWVVFLVVVSMFLGPQLQQAAMVVFFAGLGQNQDLQTTAGHAGTAHHRKNSCKY